MVELSKPHNGFVKIALEDMRIARDFFGHYLPIEVKSQLNLSTLRLENGSFIEENYRESQSDILYRVRRREHIEDAYVYLLLEAQSKSDKWMPFRLLKYICRIIDQHQHQYPKEEYLPLVVPMVFYTGTKPYHHGMDLQDLYREEDKLGKSLLFGPYPRIDVQTLTDEEIYTHQWVGLLEMVMKHIAYRDALELMNMLLEPFLEPLSKKAHTDKYIVGMLKYVIGRGEVVEVDSLLKLVQQHLSPKVEEEIMTIAEKLEQRGMQQGVQQGMQQGQYQMLIGILEDRFGRIPMQLVQHLKGLSPEELMRLSKRALHIQGIDELLQR